jgi:hypothetical protein
MSSTSLLMNSGSSDGWPARAAPTQAPIIHGLTAVAKHQCKAEPSNVNSIAAGGSIHLLSLQTSSTSTLRKPKANVTAMHVLPLVLLVICTCTTC